MAYPFYSHSYILHSLYSNGHYKGRVFHPCDIYFPDRDLVALPDQRGSRVRILYLSYCCAAEVVLDF